MARRKKIPAAPRPRAYRRRHGGDAVHQETTKKEDAPMLEYDPRPQLPFVGSDDGDVVAAPPESRHYLLWEILCNIAALSIPVLLILGMAFLLLRHFSGYLAGV